MGKSIRISDELAEKATEAAALFHRSPPQQIEYWAQIGQVIETVLSYPAQRNAMEWGSTEEVDALVTHSQSPEGKAKLLAGIHAQSGGEYWGADESGSNRTVRHSTSGG